MNISFPDGSVREFEVGATGFDVAMSISEGLARSAVAVKVNGALWDLNRPIESDAALEIVTLRDEEGLEVYRHSTAHIMALAVKRRFPDVRLAIGPVIENGFYYDFDNVSLKNEDFAAIEGEMKQIIKEKLPFERSVLSKSEALELFNDEPYKLELINDLPEGETISCYRIGEFVDLCRGPHIPRTDMVKAYKMLRLAGAYWRGNSDNKMLTRLYATSFSDKKITQSIPGGAAKSRRERSCEARPEARSVCNQSQYRARASPVYPSGNHYHEDPSAVHRRRRVSARLQEYSYPLHGKE